MALGAAGCTGDDESGGGEGSESSEPPPTTQDEGPGDPGPAGPDDLDDGDRAPWDTDPVPPPDDLVDAVEELRRPGSPSFGMPCALFAPTELGAVGLVPEPTSGHRVGRQLPLEWRDPDGDLRVTVNIWIQDNVEVEGYYDEDPEGTVLADGSVLRRLGGDLMFTVPGEGCFYEVVFEGVPDELRDLAFSSIRQIDV